MTAIRTDYLWARTIRCPYCEGLFLFRQTGDLRRRNGCSTLPRYEKKPESALAISRLFESYAEQS